MKELDALALPPVPEIKCQSLTLRRRHPQTGTFFKIGHGAVAFRLVLNVFQNSGLTHTNHHGLWNVLWTKRVTDEEWSTVTEYQRVNHFPGTWGIGRKDHLHKNIARLRKQHPAAYDFLPLTFVMPTEYRLLELEYERNPHAVFIVKPSAASCGRGIRLVNSLPTKYQNEQPDGKPTKGHVIQRYIANPLLIDGYKWDIRLYVLCTGFDPMKVYIFNEGLIRFATEPFKLQADNLDNQYMHLTNYSVNKHSATFVNPGSSSSSNSKTKKEGDEDEGGDADDPEASVESEGSKWTLTTLQKYLVSKGYDWNALQSQIQDIVVKTFISIESDVLDSLHEHGTPRRSCFELFGFDFMVDDKLKVFLIEANIMPSLACTSPLDKAVKYTLVENTLTTVGPIPFHRGKYMQAMQERRAKPEQPSPAEKEKGKRKLPPDCRSLASALTPEDKQIIMETEDEFNRRGNFTRVFPTAKSHTKYGKYFENGPRWNNQLISRWEKEKKKMVEAPAGSGARGATAPATMWPGASPAQPDVQSTPWLQL
eukprot:NODE_552_length_1818_cov_52.607333_g543_i0.p1 GENE.NODE_552_length_1818_cov_52.607333_g543_i0~~NODE_552_length_1818_cov_52.607333_g543_i0.p1  ORF type:complete len:553 (+),score=127.30 NODE_552_length_1818_cov_52.607333_g543_i0:50-1660(+)